MSFYACRLLRPVVQFYWVLKPGTLLAQRFETDDATPSACAGERIATSP